LVTAGKRTGLGRPLLRSILNLYHPASKYHIAKDRNIEVVEPCYSSKGFQSAAVICTRTGLP